MGNFISSTLSGTNAPIDSFMVYVGVPANPTACQYTDGEAARPIYDLKRRWFSEVIAIDKPYKEILSTFGRDSVYRSTQFSATLSNAVIQPMIDAQGLLNGGGVIRIVFRVKTNANYADETNTGGSFVSTGQGAARIDRVDITGAASVFPTSGFETAGEINNTIEPANAVSPGPAVGEGYALVSWKATGKPTKLMTHLHPLDGDVTRDYAPLDYKDLCGVWNSPSRLCDINGVIMSTTDHDLFEATGDAAGTAFRDNQGGYMSPAINLTGFDPVTGLNDCGLDALHVNTQAKWLIMYDCYTGIFKDLDTQGCLYATMVISYPTLQKNGATVWGGIGVISSVYWWGDYYCFTMWDEVSAFINTSNSTGDPGFDQDRDVPPVPGRRNQPDVPRLHGRSLHGQPFAGLAVISGGIDVGQR